MTNNKRLNVFLSYSHYDESHIKEFNKHINNLTENVLIDLWWDRKILGVINYDEEIKSKINTADIILLFMSANYLSSSSCLGEKETALNLRKKNGVIVIPIILSSCSWKDCGLIYLLQVLPQDGNPIDLHGNYNLAWYNVYEAVKLVVHKETEIRQLYFSDEFSSFVQNTELLSKAHSNKEKVNLDDTAFLIPIDYVV